MNDEITPKTCAHMVTGGVCVFGTRQWSPAITPPPARCAGCPGEGNPAPDEIKGLVERLKAHAGKRAPVQGLRGGIPWAMHLRAYDAYCKRYGRQDALIDLEGRGCRGGFATEELDAFIPGWRAELESPMPPDLATQAASLLTLSDEARVRAEAERDELRLAICGGEDAPGHNASLPHETILRVLSDTHATADRDAELAWDGETATSWKARLQASEALVRELVGVGRNMSFQADRLLAALRDGSVASDGQRAHASMVLAREITAINALILRAEGEEMGSSQSQPVLASNGHGEAEEPAADRAPNTAPPGVLDTNYGRSIYSLLASAWFYGGWKAETGSERAMQAIMEQMGWWPIPGEGALMTMIGRELEGMQRPLSSDPQPLGSAREATEGNPVEDEP